MITGVDVTPILVLQHCGIRKLEAVVAALALTIGACMAVEMLLAQPSRSAIASGFVPRLDSAGLFLKALRHNLVDTVLALNIACLIKAAILVLAASTAFSRGMIIGLIAWLVTELLAPANAGIGRMVIGVMVVLCGSLLA